MMSTRTLSWEEFLIHLHQSVPLNMPPPVRIAIRGIDGDWGVAAVHRDADGAIIFDLGQKLEDAT